MTVLYLDAISVELIRCREALAVVTVAIADDDGLEWTTRVEIRRERMAALASVNLPADVTYPAELGAALAQVALGAFEMETLRRKMCAADKLIPFPRKPVESWAESLNHQ